MPATGLPPMPRDRCYWAKCGSKATTKEHVPSQAFFFEGTDLGLDVKQNRFTVRSCKDHNNPFSSDEDYVAWLSYMAIENDPRAHDHATGVLFEKIKRHPESVLFRRLARSFGGFKDDGSGVSGVVIEPRAMQRVIGKIARGLHYRLTGKRLEWEPICWGRNLQGGDDQQRLRLERSARILDTLPYQSGVSGHRLVLEYGHHIDPHNRFATLKLRFFQGIEYRAIAFNPWKSGREPT